MELEDRVERFAFDFGRVREEIGRAPVCSRPRTDPRAPRPVTVLTGPKILGAKREPDRRPRGRVPCRTDQFMTR